MHYLHPRSRTTGTLFTTTLAVSFLVVALPHLLPCPVDRRQFADSYETPDGRIMRRRRKRTGDADADEVVRDGEDTTIVTAATDGNGGRPKRECPMPKPGGLMGQMMGFKEATPPPPVAQVVVQSLDKRDLRQTRNDT